jgi:hypothetical protein
MTYTIQRSNSVTARREPVAMEDPEILFGLSGRSLLVVQNEQQEIATHATTKPR